MTVPLSVLLAAGVTTTPSPFRLFELSLAAETLADLASEPSPS